MGFVEKLIASSRQQQSLLCVGLDPEPGRLPKGFRQEPVERAIVRFCQAIIEATAPYVCAYKPNLAFFEVLGPAGLRALQEVIEAIPSHIPVIADAKRGDIGNTARAYARTLFETYGCDAATVNPYMGRDSVAPSWSIAIRERSCYAVPPILARAICKMCVCLMSRVRSVLSTRSWRSACGSGILRGIVVW
ncbi:hypothetical protein KSX_38510 [Ktedonospora formicarum]|uniref:Orotidine-5'-phosphate decarboxylase n=1 Tax=Ktedonospora formicarum TaxID=2778364 RepID=A0A8J3MTK4_9CHLR|nr:orotidine-5'-phosphate decarboxylase [Ktedonospora formicarum]GHO45688.1 hypothetical protein KSX_38510 [Ktedonospora formicarum]